jgi:hypothetical protein
VRFPCLAVCPFRKFCDAFLQGGQGKNLISFSFIGSDPLNFVENGDVQPTDLDFAAHPGLGDFVILAQTARNNNLGAVF